MADTTASAILNKHLGSRAARVEVPRPDRDHLPPDPALCKSAVRSAAQSGSGVSPLATSPALCKTAVPSVAIPPSAVPLSPAAGAPQMSFAAPVILPQGDGSVKVLPGKPVAWLTPAQFAAHFGLEKSAAYRAINDGTIPPEFVEPIGKRRLRIAAAAVEHVREVWRARRDAA